LLLYAFMTVLDIEKLLAPVSPDSPCGENLEYDADYAAMEQAAAGKPDQQFGEKVIPGEEPNWPEVKSLAIGLLGRTKDLRVALNLARSCTWLNGLAGLADGLAVMNGLVGTYWQDVHPQLDPDDGNDPTFRLNAIASLCDPGTTLRAVQGATLVSSRGLGKFSYRDVLVAAGDLPPLAGSPKVEQSSIDGAFSEGNPTELIATGRVAKAAYEHFRELDKSLGELVGVSIAPPLDALGDLLKGINRLFQQKLASRGLSLEEEQAVEAEEPAAVDNEDAVESGQTEPAAANGRKVVAATTLTGEISSRDDVIRALDKICDYYKRYEPSSPVPLFLNRAKRLASKSFLEILRDLTPDALNQALAISGITDGAAAIAEVDANDI
jgi:type VI secretion system protein ImpA